jgi:hypothetical protein
LISGYKMSGGADGQVSSAETVPSSLMVVEVVALRSFCSCRYLRDIAGSCLYDLFDLIRLMVRSVSVSLVCFWICVIRVFESLSRNVSNGTHSLLAWSRLPVRLPSPVGTLPSFSLPSDLLHLRQLNLPKIFLIFDKLEYDHNQKDKPKKGVGFQPRFWFTWTLITVLVILPEMY